MVKIADIFTKFDRYCNNRSTLRVNMTFDKIQNGILAVVCAL